jgi:hypothetical protein
MDGTAAAPGLNLDRISIGVTNRCAKGVRILLQPRPRGAWKNPPRSSMNTAGFSGDLRLVAGRLGGRFRAV